MNALVQKIANQARKARFASFEYTTSKSEKARYKIQLGFSYRNLLEKSVLELETSFDEMGDDTLEVAKGLLESFKKSLEGQNTEYRKKDLYRPVKDSQGNVIEGLKYNQKENKLQVYGLVRSKVVLEPGLEKPERSSVRQAIRNSLPVGSFREFSLEGISLARIDGEILQLG